MADNSSSTYSSPPRNPNGPSDKAKNGAAIAVPIVCGFILLVFLFLAVALPRMMGRGLDEDERRKFRLNKLNSVLTAQSFREWMKTEPEKAAQIEEEEEEAICVICLDKIDPSAQIRALGCKHFFHKECLDPWFEQHHDDCPLCHKAILPPEKRSRNPIKAMSRRFYHSSSIISTRTGDERV